MMTVCRPGWAIFVIRLMAPCRPAVARAAREQLEVRPGTARFDDQILLIGLPRMLPLACGQEVHLASAGRERARVLALHAKQNELGHVTEVKADAAAVGTAVLTHLVPDNVGFVREAPSFHHCQPF